MSVTKPKLRSYRVVYAGLVYTKMKLKAASAREAAMLFVSKTRMRRNRIIVEWGFSGLEYFALEDFEDAIPELDDLEVDLELPPETDYDPAKDPAVKVYRWLCILFGLFLVYCGISLIIAGHDVWIPGSFLTVLGVFVTGLYSLLPARWVRGMMFRRRY